MLKQIKWLLLSLILTCVLSGCIPVALVVGATAGGAIIYDRRSAQTILEDREISNKVIARVHHDPVLQETSHIGVATFNHVVLLVGQALTPDLSQRAYQYAVNVSNVKRVYNQIEITPLLPIIDRSKDAWLTSRVKTMMIAAKDLNSSQIKVISENRVVYLMGVVSPKQAKLATDVARNVRGVRKVVQVFEYEQ